MVVSDFIMAGTAVVAWLHQTVVNVDLTVLSRPAVYTDACIVPIGVHTCGTVFTDSRMYFTFVHIDIAVETCMCCRADTAVVVDSIDTRGAIATHVINTVIDIHFTVHTSITYQKYVEYHNSSKLMER